VYTPPADRATTAWCPDVGTELNRSVLSTTSGQVVGKRRPETDGPSDASNTLTRKNAAPEIHHPTTILATFSPRPHKGMFWVFDHPEISGKSLTIIIKGSKLSFLTKIAFRRWLIRG